ncbi:cbb3-type cytochrome c oxidase subunit 3 [Acidimangrovimonas pyrenivorans]|uniref:Cbb3-type cytochrome c oxidase subunit 3 n=1 Tax=Acidimangrovimonas pyrenivorans TaxID=2030798 RepID=A0ABV7AGS1_9RHOB
MTHETLVYIAKTFGLLWMMAFFVVVLLRAYRPGARARHDRAARSILVEAAIPQPEDPR